MEFFKGFRGSPRASTYNF